MVPVARYLDVKRRFGDVATVVLMFLASLVEAEVGGIKKAHVHGVASQRHHHDLIFLLILRYNPKVAGS